MSSPPFPNDYSCRRVADSDARPCNICYKPTSTVFVTAGNGDFFYVCALHLTDVSFASPVPSEAYTDLIKEKEKLDRDIKHANGLAEANKPYSWNKLMSNIGWNEKKKDADIEDENKDKDKDKDKEQQKAQTYENYVAKANELKKRYAEVNDAIGSFQFKKYTLSPDFYRGRVNKRLQGKLQAKRQQEIQSGTLFPSVPNTKLG